MRLTPFLPLTLLVLTACPGDPKTDDSDTTNPTDETDSDTDSDTDTDSDSDTDADAEYTSIDGSLDLYVDTDGAVGCDITVNFTGTANPAACPDCDFNFAVEGTTADTIGDTCYFQLSLLEDGPVVDRQLAFQSEYTYSGYYGSYTYSNMLQTGYYYDYYGTIYGPGWFTVGFDGNAYGSATFDGTDLAWTFDYNITEDVYEANYYYQYCDYLYGASYFYDGNDYNGDWSYTDNTGDVWTVETVAGETVTLSVNTVAEESAFDPVMYVIGSDTCLDATADDTFECAFPPPSGYACPSVTFTGDGGPATLIIYGFDATDCGSSGAGAYTLDVGGATNATLSSDEATLNTVTTSTTVITSAGSATVQ